MDIALLYFEDCPNWKVADERLTAIAAALDDITVTRHLVETAAEAERTRFHGSSSILVDGVDVFAEPGSEVGLSGRRYLTPDGYQGAPTLDQLRAALADGWPDRHPRADRRRRWSARTLLWPAGAAVDRRRGRDRRLVTAELGPDRTRSRSGRRRLDTVGQKPTK